MDVEKNRESFPSKLDQIDVDVFLHCSSGSETRVREL